jgi:hypothetical protein
MSRMRPQHRAGPRWLASLVMVALMAGSVGAASARAASTPPVNLGEAATYAVLSGASVGNTVSAVGAPHTTLRGDLGVKADSQPTGFPPGLVTGITRIGATAAPAHADLVAAYSEVAARPGGAALAGQLAGLTLAPGLHSTVAAVSNTGTVTLDGGGDPNAVFVFKIGGALTMAVGAQVVLTNGTRASRVFWQVGGAAAVGANAKFAGTLMALDAVAMGAGTQVNGRALARNGAVSLDSNEFYSVPPAVTIAGGSPAITTDTTPTISGTTDVESPGTVTVTVGGQTLQASPVDGAWSVTSGLLENGSYPVTASVSDAAGNPGSAAQQLTVDTVLPVVTIDGPETAITNDATPTITGASDVAPGTKVLVTFPGQVRTALVQADGTWNVTPAALTDGTRTVSVTVEDPAGNDGTDAVELTVDTDAPAAAITGGVSALTNDATPSISGTAAVPPGSTVTMNLADETLYASVGNNGAWTVTAAALSDGPHRVVMSVSDPAGNRTTSSQVLTIDTVAPTVAISGGPEATTADVDPTLTGTSNAAPGTTVTVTIAGQTLTTLLQPNGTWNVTPNAIGEGTWKVLVSAPDPAGNVGSARQTLVIGAGPPPTPVETPTPVATAAPITTPPAAVSPVQTTTVAPSGAQKVTGSAGTIGIAITAPASGLVRATATGKVRIKGVKRAIVLTSRTAIIPSGQTLTLKIKPKGTKKVAAAALRRIRLAIKEGRSVVATITVRLVDSAGVTRVVTRKVKLKR